MKRIVLASLLAVSLFGCGSDLQNAEGSETAVTQGLSASATCAEVDSWIAQNRQAVPANRKGLLAFPKSQQRRLFSALNAEAKVAVWQARVDEMIAEAAGNASRQASLAEARKLVTPELYSGNVAAHAAAGERLVKLGLVPEEFLDFGGGVPSPRALAAATATSCDCSLGISCALEPNSACFHRDVKCTPTADGCGWFGGAKCTGQCIQYASPGLPSVHPIGGGVNSL